MIELKLVYTLLLIWSFGNFSTFADTECYSCDPKRYLNYCWIIDDDSSIDTCKSGFDRCYTIIDEIDGQVHRGCVGDNRFPDENTLQKCSDPDRCEICEDNHCNGRAISDICIKCGNSGTSPDCDGDLLTDMGICSLKDMKQSDGCFLKVADGHTYTRGCMRDLNTDELKQCRKRSENCQSCIFPNCNQKDDFTTMCYECNGRNDTNCVETVESMTKVRCDGLSKTCVTGIDADGFIRRGCYSYDKLLMDFPYGYDVCPGSLCNSRIHPVDWLSCYQCEGKSECEDSINLHPKKCNNLRDQCYAYLDGDGTFYRGCLREESRGLEKCEQNAAKCEVCDENGCNSQSKHEMNSSNILNAHFIHSLISVGLSFWLRM